MVDATKVEIVMNRAVRLTFSDGSERVVHLDLLGPGVHRDRKQRPLLG